MRPKVAQMLARHSDIRLTLGVYAHAELTDQTAAINRRSAGRLKSCDFSYEVGLVLSCCVCSLVQFVPFVVPFLRGLTAAASMEIGALSGPFL
ncbi:MAG: hypothetical protein ACKOUR_09585 [Planctomycetota bacterium]